METYRRLAAIVGFAVVPALHPLLLPWVGVASHLLWWAHVLPVALLTYRHGRRSVLWSIGGSVAMLVVGERLFGAGYGLAADWPTAASLATALVFTEILVAWFALYARGVSRRYQLLFHGAETGILRTSADGRVLEANPAAEELIGSPRRDLLGRRLGAIPGLAEIPSLDGIESTGGWTGTIELERTGGPPIRHLVVAAMAQQEPPGHQVLLMDRTPAVARELERERQRKLATLGEALAGVAHELKNPLAVILVEEELARTDPAPQPDALLGTMAEMRRQGERMRALIDELLGYSRPATGRGEVDLAALLRRLLRIEEMIRDRKVRWEDRIRWEGVVRVEEARIEQIATNLLSNAAEAMGGEGGRGELRCWTEDDLVHVEVADSGPGIPDELMDRIFLPFVTSKSEAGGTGLGLAISRRLARAMGGELTARNRPSGGAAFRLTLPLAPQSPLSPAPDASDRAPTSPDRETRSAPGILPR